ncbi:hypothetical protein PU560_16255 [Georgenia sp. 10Sc9-8]|uniref:Tripartite tricarboxylate transporter TctB family protein n=1 Tax=Georgenia halotolerans TaxID=3028317 RepID=A0ABT5U189_9MICO|nr:hypothetical protein [Georgenia halotolerans]
MTALTALRFGFATLWIIAFSYAIVASFSFPSISGMYPRVAASIGLTLALLTLLLDIRAWRRSGDAVGSEADGSASAEVAAHNEGAVGRAFLRAARYGAWLVGLIFLFWLIGAVAAAGIFVLAFLLVESNARWPLLIAGPLAIMALLLGLANAVNLYWPEALFPLIS